MTSRVQQAADREATGSPPPKTLFFLYTTLVQPTRCGEVTPLPRPQLPSMLSGDTKQRLPFLLPSHPDLKSHPETILIPTLLGQ